MHDARLERLLAWYVSGLLVLAGVWFGQDYLPQPHAPEHGVEPGFLTRLLNWDGQWYRTILVDGYTFDPHLASSVAYFPAYPLAGRLITVLTGCSPEIALLAITQSSLLAIVWLIPRYVQHAERQRALGVDSVAERGAEPIGERGAEEMVILAFLLYPLGLFFRVAYTEAPFLLILLLVFYGMWQRWPVWQLAVLTGLATAVRAPGVALIPPVLIHIGLRSSSVPRRIFEALVWLPVCGWGILAFMAWQAMAFGEGLAFMQAQRAWSQRAQPEPWALAGSLVTLRPLWDVYQPGSAAYWRLFERGVQNPLFSLQFANPIWFVATAGLVAYGRWKRWITRSECSLAALLLVIPYVTQSHRMCGQGLGRMSSVAFPVYLVLGQIAARLPPLMRITAFGCSAVLLFLYAALFASWHLII